MRPIRRILIAIKDPAARPSAALRKAAQLARSLGARLELFHAITEPLYVGPPLYSDQGFADLRQQVQTRVLRRLETLAQSLARVGRQRALRVTVAAEWDLPAYEAIIRRALRSKADLIVAEPHHGSRLMPLLHFNDWELLRGSPIPVLLVRRARPYTRPVILAAVDPRDRRSRLDMAILEISAALEHRLKGCLHSVHAYTPVAAGRLPSDILDERTAGELNQKIAASAQRRYDGLLRPYALPRPRRHLLAMPAADAIAETAAATRSDIVALGVIARGGWRRRLIGGTAERLLDRLGCDLLVVKSPSFRPDIARQPVGPRIVAIPLTPET